MVVRAGVGDPEADRDAVEERRFAEVVADREDELVLAGGDMLELERPLTDEEFAFMEAEGFGIARRGYWRLGAESNRCTRLCRPLHDHSAT